MWYSKEEALKLSDEIGVKKAAKQLGIQYTRCSIDGESETLLPKLRSIRCLMKNLNNEILSLSVITPSCGKRMTFSRTHSVFRKRPEEVKTSERHLFVNEFRHKYGAKAICKFLRISESGYYRWLRNQSNSARQLLLVIIQGIYQNILTIRITA